MSKKTFLFTRQQKIGLLYFFIIIAVLQIVFVFDFFPKSGLNSPDQIQWENHQIALDKKKNEQDSISDVPRKFNPNYITDYKGYQLGMSINEIDRLLQFRKSGQFVNSVQDFKNVTGVSDSLLMVIAPRFKFPDWVINKQQQKNANGFHKSKIVQLDINEATSEDLQKVSGIGNVLATRILKTKDQLGGFVSMQQIGWIYGISSDVFEKIQQYFVIKQKPSSLLKLAINSATLKELIAFPYFDYTLAKEIIIYRTMHGNDIGIKDLYHINGFPQDKVAVIGLYLQY